MKHLDKIQHPRDLRKLSVDQLKELAGEIRQRIIEVVGANGGHLASNLGVAELTIALHYCFDFENDHLVFDVGHQCYPHKLLTGRHPRFDTLRKAGGVSGFPDPAESPFDSFKVGHAGTSVATAVGLAQGDQMMGRDCRTVALVGDASIVNGLAFEGLNQAGLLKRQMLVVLNDNNWGISPSRGALAEYLAKFRTSSLYEEVKQRAQQILPRVPIVGKPMFDMLNHLKEGIKATVSPHQVFENMGFVYVGPVNGHDIGHLIQLLQGLRDVPHPVLLHVHTNKGQGADFAIEDPDCFHSPHPFRLEAGKVTLQVGSGRSWTKAFAETLIECAREDERVMALTAGMPAGTGLNLFAKEFPDRFRDIGIAESATVDIAAGLARQGLRPVVAVYSTFLQRAFDQVFQDVVLQGLPVVFCMDRAGLVGGDGAVHHGFLDIAYLRGLPNMVLAAPADENEMKALLRFALRHNGPVAIRYPRAEVPESIGQTPPFVPGESRMMLSGRDATILAYGAAVSNALDAAELLATDHISVRVVNARFAKPIDRRMLRTVLSADHPVITAEDHSVTGGFGAAILEEAAEMRLPTERIVRLGLPADRFVAQGSRVGQLAECGIDAAGIAATVQRELEQLRTNGMEMVRPASVGSAPPPVKS
ncbi:MAG TPA: 1-deoxy-D-xylulose-5-phosphate synthase [Phycisphaerae bacterium]|nr:1-deoxy-D-xylulose-5-phosphate synthase [Phycisphaerae bacterium]